MVRKRQSQASRRRKAERDRQVPRDPCGCDERCPFDGCRYTCMGGHANYPGHHLCAELRQWGDRFLTRLTTTYFLRSPDTRPGFVLSRQWYVEGQPRSVVQ